MVCSFFLRSRLLGYFLSPSRFPKRARLPTSRLKDVFNHADSSLSLSLSLFLYASVCVYFIVYFVGRQITCSYDLSGRKPSAGPPPSAPSVRFTTTGTILPKSSIASFRWFQRFLSSCFFCFVVVVVVFFSSAAALALPAAALPPFDGVSFFHPRFYMRTFAATTRN